MRNMHCSPGKYVLFTKIEEKIFLSSFFSDQLISSSYILVQWMYCKDFYCP